MTNEQYETLVVATAQLGILQAEVKRRAMIFDCGEKERIAQAQGLHFSHYHKYTFVDWIEAKKEYYAKLA